MTCHVIAEHRLLRQVLDRWQAKHINKSGSLYLDEHIGIVEVRFILVILVLGRLYVADEIRGQLGLFGLDLRTTDIPM